MTRPPLLSADAALAAALFAVDPVGIGGVVLHAPHGPWRDAWLARLRELLPAAAPWRRLPLHIADERLLGGLDLGATLQAGRPVGQRGVLAEADGGVLLLAMAERLAGGTVARLAAVIDGGAVHVERDGIGLRHDARFGVVALDEGIGDDEGLPAALRDRLGLWLAADAAPAGPGGEPRPAGEGGSQASVAASALPRSPEPATAGRIDPAPEPSAADVQAARQRLPDVTATDDVLQALCAAALALGVPSLRASLLALRVARAAAALAGRRAVGVDDAALAARLVLAPRATQLPASPPDSTADADAAGDADVEADAEADAEAGAHADAPEQPLETPPPSEPPPAPSGQPDSSPSSGVEPAMPPPDRTEATAAAAVEDTVLAAALAAIPAGLLAALKLGPASRAPHASPGRAGVLQQARLRGRPSGVQRGQPAGGARLNVLETLRAAAPWQRLRRSQSVGAGEAAPAVRVRRDDFRITRFKQRSVTTTIFVVDASGSAALHRLAEAKGAVELLLADCYVRRDNVALLAFRGRVAELLLPPTRSLVRAKRSLAGLPGGGGTPLACGIDAAVALAEAVRRRGETPIVVLLTDGRANIARDGTPGRPRAGDDALAAAHLFRAAGIAALLLDTSAQLQPASAALAQAMGAAYLPLPHADAAGLSQAVRTVQAARRAAIAGGGATRPGS